MGIDGNNFHAAVEALKKIQEIDKRSSNLAIEKFALVPSQIACLGHQFNLAEGRHEFQITEPNSLWYYLQQTLSLQVTNPRDKVYAVSGLCQASVLVRYEIPVEQVYLEAAKYMATKDSTLDFLRISGLCSYKDDNQLDLNLPSWVPNFYNFVRISYWR